MKTPMTFLLGMTHPNINQLKKYLEYTNQTEFLQEITDAYEKIGPMALSSFYAKLCYKSLVLGKNANVSRVRDVEENLKSIIGTGHGSVLEHVWFNFVTTDCSRVFTHELVRHRVGTAFSQTSGRYVAIDELDIVLPPELAQNVIEFRYDNGETKMMTVEELVETHAAETANVCQQLRNQLVRDDAPFDLKKKITSAIRRLAPNGQTNEIGWSANIRSLRHMIEMRTSRHAEWEIRVVFNQVASMLLEEWPMILYGGTPTVVDGMNEWKGLKV